MNMYVWIELSIRPRIVFTRGIMKNTAGASYVLLELAVKVSLKQVYSP